jgi:hypothetical protein
MKKILLLFLTPLSLNLGSQNIITGPGSSDPPYVIPSISSSTVTSIITAGNSVGSFVFCGTPDGLGAFDNGDGSFTLLVNHEFNSNAGNVRSHGSTGAFVTKLNINKSTLAVNSANDLILNVHIWNGTSYNLFNSSNPSPSAALGRFCSGDLPAPLAFYNPATGKGSTEKIYLNGEETGNEGRAFAHIVTGTTAGNSYELPYLGKCNIENAVARPYATDKTVVAVNDDSYPGQVYIYIGNKSTLGTEIEKAGLSGGKLYGIAIKNLPDELNSSVPVSGTTFSLVNLGQVQSISGTSLNTLSNNLSVTNFFRPEDGAWDPSHPEDYYFVTTNTYNDPSRLWRLRFNDLQNPETGGTVKAVLAGTEGHKMLDNIAIDRHGFILMQEDVGNVSRLGKIWQYNIKSGGLTEISHHDPSRFLSGGANFLTEDEESSGIIDAHEILGPGMFLLSDMAHYPIPAPVVEGGQILALYNPASALADLKEFKDDGSLEIFPNPASSFVTVRIKNCEINKINVRLYDMNGKLTIPAISEQVNSEGTFKMNVSGIAPGKYILKVICDDKEKQTELLINH